jgi:Gas vesicle synthesis protein GvpL/GvpF
MAASAKTDQAATDRGTGSDQQKGWYVYGVVPADVEPSADVRGVGDPPGQIGVIRSGDLAALASEVDLSQRLGSPEDLTAHQEILDATAAEVPVLPFRFGAVLASEDAVAQELLDANHDEFAEALKELEGRVEYVVKGRYVESVILAEVLSENPQAAQLADQIRGADPDATRDARIQLGEIINEAVTAKREQDTRTLGEAMADHCVASVVRDPTHELDAVHVAFLIESGKKRDMEQVIEKLARDWEGRIELRLIGPMAAYDFVTTAGAEG